MFQSALDYHNSTSYDRHDMKGHYMDWPNQPSVFKEYGGVAQTPLLCPESFQRKTLVDLCQGKLTKDQNVTFDYPTLGGLLHLAHAVTAQAKHGGAYFYYRSVASAGALYPFETYINIMNVDGLQDGLYHHNLAGNVLEKLHDAASADQLKEHLHLEVGSGCGLVFFLTSIFFRSSWKYRDRAYRYHLLDTGHLLENLTLALKYYDLDYQILFDFDDGRTNRFLNVDPDREACLVAVSVNIPTSPAIERSEEPLGFQQDLSFFSRVSPQEVRYSAINDIHDLTSNKTRQNIFLDSASPDLGLSLKLSETVHSPQFMNDCLDYPDTVFLRRSSRNFVKKYLSSEDFNSMIRLVGCACDGDSSSPSHFGVGLGFLVSRVQGMNPGFYFYDDITASVYLAKEGDMLDEMTHICLDQSWLSNCAVHFLLMLNFAEADSRFGPRGYRRALMASGRLGQRLYVAATSLRLGCCGIGAFYDSEATRLLGLNNESRLAYLLGVGPTKKRNPDNP